MLVSDHRHLLYSWAIIYVSSVNISINLIGFDLDDTLNARNDFYPFVFEVIQTMLERLEVSFEEFYQVFQGYSDD